MKAAIPSVIFILGAISICAFLTPVYWDEYISENVISHSGHSNIFSTHSIDYSRLKLYIIVWTLLCVALHFAFRNFKRS